MKYPERFGYDSTCNFVIYKARLIQTSYPLYIEYFTFEDLVLRFAGEHEIYVYDGIDRCTLSNVLYFNSGAVWQIRVSPKLFTITKEIRMVN